MVAETDTRPQDFGMVAGDLTLEIVWTLDDGRSAYVRDSRLGGRDSACNGEEAPVRDTPPRMGPRQQAAAPRAGDSPTHAACE